MSRPLRLISRLAIVAVVVVVSLVAYRAYSRPHTATDWELAQAALAVGDRNTAVVHLRNVVRDNPNHGEAYLAVSQLFLAHAELNGKPSTYATNDRALPFFVQAAKFLPQNVAVQQQLLEIYLDRGQVPEAIEVAGRIADKLPKDSDVVTARAHHVIGQYEQAMDGLNQVLATKQPAHFQAWRLRAKIDEASENERHLQQVFDEAIARACTLPARDVALLNAREHAAMADLLRRGIAQSPDVATAERRTGAVLDAWDRVARAEAGGPRQGEVIALAAEEASWASAAFSEKHSTKERNDVAAAFDERAEAIRRFAVAADQIRTSTRMISVRRAFERGEVAQAAELAAKGVDKAALRNEALELRQTAGRLFILARSSDANVQIKALSADREWAGHGRLLAGEQAMAMGNPQDALAHFRAALPLLGHTREVRAGLAEAFIALGCWAEARAELAGLLRRTPSSDAAKPVIGEPPHRALLLQLFKSSPDLINADLADATHGSR